MPPSNDNSIEIMREYVFHKSPHACLCAGCRHRRNELSSGTDEKKKKKKQNIYIIMPVRFLSVWRPIDDASATTSNLIGHRFGELRPYINVWKIAE